LKAATVSSLDTQTLVWLLQGRERIEIRSRATKLAATGQAGALLAPISVWIIARLVANGGLALNRDVIVGRPQY